MAGFFRRGLKLWLYQRCVSSLSLCYRLVTHIFNLLKRWFYDYLVLIFGGCILVIRSKNMLVHIGLMQCCSWVGALYLITAVIVFVGLNNYWLNAILIG